MTARPTSEISNWLKQGFEALNAGDLKRVEVYCQKIMGANPKLPQGHFLVGLMALEMGERRVAANALYAVTKLAPDHAGAWAHLAKIFCELGYTSRADEALLKAEKTSTDIPALQNVMGTVNSLIGEHHKASGWYEKAFNTEPHNTSYGVNLANALNFVGNKTGAVECAEKVIGLDPENAQAHWILAGMNRATSPDHGDQMMELAARVTSDQSRSFLYYGAGKVFEDVQDWSRAFNAFDQGAKAKHKTQSYDEAGEVALFDSLHQNFDRGYMDRVVSGAPKDFAPIFIVGQPRTGTTLIERVITAHSHVRSAGELQQFYLSIRRGSKITTNARISAELINAATGLDPAELGKAYQAATRHYQTDNLYFVDKMPVNYLYVPLIAKALPNAKIIHVNRGAMDSCFSSYKQLFADAYPHSYDLKEMARHHVRYRKLMAHWQDVVGDRMIDVSYEDTVANLETSARRMLEFLGLEWEDACLNFHQQSGAVSTASAAQVREPVHARSVGRWKQYEQQLQPVNDILSKAGFLS